MYQSGDDASVLDIQIDAHEVSGSNADPEAPIVFPDGNVLFTADFQRSGTDLLLMGQETTAAILGYFRDERRRDLATPEGARLTGEAVDALTRPETPGQYAQAAAAADLRIPIGRVEKVSGTATVLRNGVQLELRLGDTVSKGDVVQTGSESSLTIKFNDGSVFGLSSNARMVLNDMVYAADSHSNSALFILVQGVIGFVAGRIAKTGDLKIDTPVATMAIRGTAVHTEIAASSGITKVSLLTEPDGTVGSFALLDRNNPARVITTISDARVSTLLTPVAASDPRISQVTKSADDLRAEGDLVRSLFQVISPEPRQRRGSSDFEDGPIVPASLHQPADLLDGLQFATPHIPERAEVRAPPLPLLLVPPAPIDGTAMEDGPLARLGSSTDLLGGRLGAAAPLVIVPGALPPGVKYVAATRSFTLDPSHTAYQHLAAGEAQIVTVNYNLVVEGGRVPASVSWTVSGANDAPVVTGALKGAAMEDRSVSTISALAKAFDVDAGTSLSVEGLLSRLPAGVTYDAATKSFTLNPAAYQHLAAGVPVVVKVDYAVSDGITTVPASVSWKVTGTNDVPVITSAAPLGTVTEVADLAADENNVTHSQSGVITFADVDTHDTHTATFAPQETRYQGTFSLDASAIDRGSVGWTFSVPDSVLDSLAAGQVLVQRYDVSVTDRHGTTVGTVRVALSGANDAPLAADDAIIGVDEARPTVLALLSNDRDIDGDALHIVQWTSPAEGSVFKASSGHLAFDPGDDFTALSAGETASISFAYTVSDGEGGIDTANVMVRVQGEGTYSSPLKTDAARAVLGFNQQPVTLTLEAPSATTTATADLRLTIGLGPVVQPQMNILYLIDVSGSTSGPFAGMPVGDLNGDGNANTVLDAEIASLTSLTERIRGLGFSPSDVTVTVIPFNGSADPTDATDSAATAVNAATFSLGGADEQAIANFLRDLDASGQTNFTDALRVANERLMGLDQGDERNFLYFLSDGIGQGSVGDELATLNNVYEAKITAVGVGADARLSQLNVIDNTGGASRLTSPDQLDTAVLGLPLSGGTVVDLDVFVNGQEITELGREDLIRTPQGLALNALVGGLERLTGDANVVSATIKFASGEVMTTELSIAGALPRSTDFIV